MDKPQPKPKQFKKCRQYMGAGMVEAYNGQAIIEKEEKDNFQEQILIQNAIKDADKLNAEKSKPKPTNVKPEPQKQQVMPVKQKPTPIKQQQKPAVTTSKPVVTNPKPVLTNQKPKIKPK